MRVLKWSVKADDKDHPIGSGRVVLVDSLYGPESVQVWTEEPDSGEAFMRRARVYGTGQVIPDRDEHVGSVALLDGALVWHVYGAPRD